jgi:hypothetical protein
MNKLDMLDLLNAISGEIGEASDDVVRGLSEGHAALRRLNAMQNKVQHAISLVALSFRTDPAISDIAKSGNSSETEMALRHGPQAQDGRETVTSAGELVGGVGDGTVAGKAPGEDTHAAQTVQAVAVAAPGEPGAAPDAVDQVLDLWATGTATILEISDEIGVDAQAIIEKARRFGDPRAARGDLRQAEGQA